MLKAKITRIFPDVDLPAYHSSESAGFDIAAGEDAVLSPGEVRLVRTGLVVESPEGYFLLITSRSSLARKKGLMLGNGVGTIDRDYSGPDDELRLVLYNFSNAPVEVKKGERLVQGIFLPVSQVEWDEVESIRESSRGGIGSTGGYKEVSPSSI